MKKIFVILGVCAITAIVAYAQLVEVRGVETKMVKSREKGDEYSNFEFRNTNKFKVSVEAELWTTGYGLVNEGRKSAKDFVLSAGETYTWKTELWHTGAYTYYVKYKAYKAD